MANSDPLPVNHECRSGTWLALGAIVALSLETGLGLHPGWIFLGAMVVGYFMNRGEAKAAEARQRLATPRE